MNPRLIVGAVAGAAAAVVIGTTVLDQGEQVSAPPPGPSQFNVSCPRSHTNLDDPIVFPGNAGASHRHEFFGNKTTNAFSTIGSLDAGATSCVRPLDRAGYWVPALYKDGVQVPPTKVLVYYRGAALQPNVEPFPHGLKVIAGNSKATAPQSAAIITWNCASSGIGKGFVQPPTRAECSLNANPFREGIGAGIKFPNCSNGLLDSADHKAHMAYAAGTPKACPVSHPVEQPQIQVNAHYPVFGPGVTLASGPHYTMHADFFNAWNQVELERLIDGCINASKDCGGGG